VTEIEPSELLRRLQGGQPLTVLDIREAEEFASWGIPGAVNLPVYHALRSGRAESFLEGAHRIPRDRPVVAVCRQGIVSRRAAELLGSLGYQATSLKGGMRGWGGVHSEARIPLRRENAVLVQVRRNGKGCLSYVVGGRAEAAVVDPSVDPSAYEAIASREGLRIRYVIETHVHADHISRGRELCQRTGARLFLPPNDRVSDPYEPFGEGDRLRVGDVELEALATPGHTAESTCYFAADEALLTGDTLFLDGVGRPDLERGDEGAEAAARRLWQSLRGLLNELEEKDPLVLPAHTSGPVGFDPTPVARALREVRAWAEPLLEDEGRFVARVIGRLGAKPPNFDRIMAINEGRLSLGAADPLELEAGPNRCACG